MSEHAITDHDLTALGTTSGECLIAVDRDGRIRGVSEPLLAERGDERAELLGTHASALFDKRVADQFETTGTAASESEVETVETALQTGEDERIPCTLRLCPLRTDAGAVGTIGIVSDRTQDEAIPAPLSETLRELLKARTRESVIEASTAAVERETEAGIGCVWLYNSDEMRLEIASLTEHARAIADSNPAYDFEFSTAGYALRTGEPVIDEQPHTDVFETQVASLHFPIGTKGVLTVICRSTGDGLIDRFDHLAAATDAALSRVETDQRVRKRKQALQLQTDICQRIRAIESKVFDATDAETVLAKTCEKLVASTFISSAWIGSVSLRGDRIEPRVSSGVDETYLHTVGELPLSMLGGGTVETAVETNRSVFVRQDYVHEQELPAESDGRTPSFEVFGAVPIQFRERVCGVLVITGNDERLSDAHRQFDTLGRLIGSRLNHLEHTELLHSNTVVELEFEIADSDEFHTAITETLDCVCQYESTVLLGGGKTLNYYRISGADPEHIRNVADDFEMIDHARITGDWGEDIMVETKAKQSTVHRAIELGANLRRVRAADGVARVTFEIPQSSNVRQIVEKVRASYDSVELISKREHDHATATGPGFQKPLEGELTEKQRSALESAYASGYYNWPRERTAKELAESMDVTSSTLHEHLRKAESKLVTAFFEQSKNNRQIK